MAGRGHGRATGNSSRRRTSPAIAALVRSKHPGLRPFQVKAVLWATAANVLAAPASRAGRIARATMTTGTASPHLG